MPFEIILSIIPWTSALLLGTFFLMVWQRDRRSDLEIRRQQLQLERQRATEEAERREKERSDAEYQKYIQQQKEEETAIRAQAGNGSGGYIIVDLPDATRGLFHDLLKGFEEFARLKGYSVSFSVDSTFHNRIAFKFTLTDPDVIVGSDRVRRDIREYLERVSQGASLDDLPRVISLEEHDVLVTTLKNRISFLQHSYNLAKNSAEFYESLIRRTSMMPVLPAQSIVLQTGGTYSAPSYTALNSPQALLGNNNAAENNIRIAVTYKERKEQIDGLADLIIRLQSQPPDQHRDDAIRNIANVKDELEHVESPEQGRVAKWLQRAKEAIQLGSLGHETVQAAMELFKAFGIR